MLFDVCRQLPGERQQTDAAWTALPKGMRDVVLISQGLGVLPKCTGVRERLEEEQQRTKRAGPRFDSMVPALKAKPTSFPPF